MLTEHYCSCAVPLFESRIIQNREIVKKKKKRQHQQPVNAENVGKGGGKNSNKHQHRMCVQTAIKTQYFIFMTKNRALVGFHHNVFVTLIHEPQIAFIPILNRIATTTTIFVHQGKKNISRERENKAITREKKAFGENMSTYMSCTPKLSMKSA